MEPKGTRSAFTSLAVNTELSQLPRMDPEPIRGSRDSSGYTANDVKALLKMLLPDLPLRTSAAGRNSDEGKQWVEDGDSCNLNGLVQVPVELN